MPGCCCGPASQRTANLTGCIERVADRLRSGAAIVTQTGLFCKDWAASSWVVDFKRRLLVGRLFLDLPSYTGHAIPYPSTLYLGESLSFQYTGTLAPLSGGLGHRLYFCCECLPLAALGASRRLGVNALQTALPYIFTFTIMTELCVEQSSQLRLCRTSTTCFTRTPIQQPEKSTAPWSDVLDSLSPFSSRLITPPATPP